MKELAKQETELKASINKLLDDSGSESLLIGEFKATRKLLEKSALDSAKLKRDMPDIYSEFCKKSTYITLEIA